MSSRQNGFSDAEQQGIRPRYRRAFGCVTWIYMATLAFLAVASLGMMPIWFIAGWDLFSILEGITFYAILIFLPCLILGAIVGARTYRSERRQATRNGAAVGAVVGVAGFAFPIWLENIASGATVLYWLAVLPVVISGLLLVYAVFPSKLNLQQRQRLVWISAILTGITGLVLLGDNFSLLQLFVAVVAILAGAAAGWTAGIGHARAGGEEMLPPGVERVR
ncbi:hypothetical protein BH24ACT21_BH24ACT21_11270 [soil metagenome]|jgi:hypothetical protein